VRPLRSVRLSVSDLPPPSFTAELNGPCVRAAVYSYNAAAIYSTVADAVNPQTRSGSTLADAGRPRI